MSSTPAHWLIKSEPEKYAYDDLVRDGRTVWDGVRNNQAALYLKAMKAIGDLALYYHSNIGLEIVAVAKVVKEAFLDPSDSRRPLQVAVEVAAPDHALKKTVTLVAMKANPRRSPAWPCSANFACRFARLRRKSGPRS